MKILFVALFGLCCFGAASALAATSQPTFQSEPFQRPQEPFQSGQQQPPATQPVFTGRPGVVVVPQGGKSNPMVLRHHTKPKH